MTTRQPIYIRPERAKPYGKDNGSSYDDAFMINEVPSDAVKPGDKVIVSGKFTAPSGKSKPVCFPFSGTEKDFIQIEGNPADLWLMNNRHLDFSGRSYLGFKGLALNECANISAEMAHHINFSNGWSTNQKPAAIDAFTVRPGNDWWMVKNWNFQNVGNGVYSRATAGQSANYLRVINCVGRDLSHGPWTVKDGHLVGIQGGHGHIVKGNKAYNCGTAYSFWASKDVPMTDCVFENNYALGCRKLETAEGHGLEISGTHNVEDNLPEPGWRSGFVVKNNRFVDCQGYGFTSNIRDPIEESGNTYKNCAEGNRRNNNPFD